MSRIQGPNEVNNNPSPKQNKAESAPALGSKTIVARPAGEKSPTHVMSENASQGTVNTYNTGKLRDISEAIKTGSLAPETTAGLQKIGGFIDLPQDFIEQLEEKNPEAAFSLLEGLVPDNEAGLYAALGLGQQQGAEA